MESKDLYLIRKKIQTICKNANLDDLDKALNEKLNSRKFKKFIDDISINDFNLSIGIRCTPDTDSKLLHNIIDNAKSVLKDFILENTTESDVIKYLTEDFGIVCNAFTVSTYISLML